jgi:hypothetical protein
MAPTTVTVESVTTPIAVSRQASVRNSTNVTLRVASSRVRPISSSQITASAGSPTASSSASWALLESLVGLAGEHGVEDLEADRAAVMDFQRLQVLDHVVGAFAGDVGGNLVARRVQGRTGVQQNVRDPHLLLQHADHVVTQALRSDHPQVQHARAE